MAKTYNDLIQEYVNYPHSMEHYELMKESANLDIQMQFIGNQEHKQYMESMGVTFEGNYFSESVDNVQMNALYESADGKKKGIFSKIGASIKKVWEHFVKFIAHLWAKTDADNRHADKIRAKLKGFTMDGKSANQFINEMHAKFDMIQMRSTKGVYTNLSGKKNWASVKFAEEVPKNNTQDMVNGMIYLALETAGNVYLGSGNNEGKSAVDVEDLVDMMKTLIDAKEVTPKTITTIRTKYDNAVKNAMEHGVAVPVNTKKRNDLMEKCRLLSGTFDNNMGAIAVDGDKNGISAQDVEKLNRDIHTAFGATMSLMTSYENFRKAALKSLGTMVGITSGNAEGSNGNDANKEGDKK